MILPNGPEIEKRQLLPTLTALRFFAALAVFMFHISLFNSPIPPFGRINLFQDTAIAMWFEWMFRQMGYLGVSFFFVLSGFVVTWSTRPNVSTLTFWKRRFLKIYPNHVVMWALSLLLFAGSYTSFSTGIVNLLLVHGFFSDPSVYVSVSPPSWSLSCELLFYLLFPFLIPLIKNIRKNHLWIYVAACFFVMILLQVVTQYVITDHPKSPITPVSSVQFWFGYIFPVTRMVEFIIGMIMARVVMSGLWTYTRMVPMIVLLVICYAASKIVPFVYSFGVMTILPIVCIICTSAVCDLSNLRIRALCNPVMQKLGEISFGFYMAQGVTIFYIRRLFAEETFSLTVSIILMIGIFILSLAAGWMLYTFVESPVMHWSRRAQKPRRLTNTVTDIDFQ